MTFALTALAMVAAALAIALPPLLRRGEDGDNDNARADNIAAARENLRALRARAEAGEIAAADAAEYESEIKSGLLRDVEDPPAAPPAATAPPRRDRRAAAALAAAALLLATPPLYFAVGEPALLSPPAPAAAPGMGEITARLKDRLRQQPEDAEARYWLGRALAASEDYAAAADQFAAARANGADNADVLVAEINARMMAGGDAEKPVAALLKKGLGESPRHPGLLWLAGLSAENAGDAKAAEAFWRQAKNATDDNDLKLQLGLAIESLAAPADVTDS